MSVLAEHLRAVTIADVEQAPRPTARLGRYAVWQVRDYFRGVGGATLVLSGLAIVMLTLSSPGAPRHSITNENTIYELLTLLGLLGPIFATSSLVADDRSKGHYRFLLAKPVNPVRFYAQAFALRGAGFVAITAAVWCAGALLFGAGSFIGAISYAALCFLMVGGVSFLLSTMTGRAWIATLVLAAASGVIFSLTHVASGWRLVFRALYAVLPPFHVSGAISEAFLPRFDRLHRVLVLGAAGPDLPSAIAWFGGYGVLAIAAALLIIRRREWPL